MGSPCRKWTTGEIAILRQAYETCRGIDSLPERLNRSRAAICARAYKLGLGGVLHNSEAVLQYHLALALNGGRRLDGRSTKKRMDRWIAAGLKVQLIHMPNAVHRLVRLEDFWEFAEKHQEMFDFHMLEPHALGPEPDWVQEKRQRDYDHMDARRYAHWTDAEYHAMLHKITVLKMYGTELEKRTGRSLNAINNKLRSEGSPLRVGMDAQIKQGRWSAGEDRLLVKQVLAGLEWYAIAAAVGRSLPSVRHHCNFHYGTSSLPELRRIFKTIPTRDKLIENERHKANMAGLVAGIARRAARRKGKDHGQSS